MGTTEQFQITGGLTLAEGRFLSAAECDGGRPVCVIGADLATNLFLRRIARRRDHFRQRPRFPRGRRAGQARRLRRKRRHRQRNHCAHHAVHPRVLGQAGLRNPGQGPQRAPSWPMPRRNCAPCSGASATSHRAIRTISPSISRTRFWTFSTKLPAPSKPSACSSPACHCSSAASAS